uniref:Uncharacterized protein n=1 Tax=Vespula pensylvanica TaxID=30213 RepID=A0A834UCR3_VESPE|nr:hypothetical protein H0235_004191 [Vespula pensylvanica]
MYGFLVYAQPRLTLKAQHHCAFAALEIFNISYMALDTPQSNHRFLDPRRSKEDRQDFTSKPVELLLYCIKTLKSEDIPTCAESRTELRDLVDLEIKTNHFLCVFRRFNKEMPSMTWHY